MVSQVSSTTQALEIELRRLVALLREAFGQQLRTIALYGSAAADDFVPGQSDVNVLVLLASVTPEALRRAKPALASWPSEPPLAPLFLSPEELQASTDVFPIELLDMRDRHRLLWGDDLLAAITASEADLRRQLEFELRGKWLRLRQSYLRDAGDADALRSLVRESLSTFQVLAAAALRLGAAGGNGPAGGARPGPGSVPEHAPGPSPSEPSRRAALFARTWEVFHLEPGVLERAIAVKEGRSGWPDEEMERGFERYLACVERLLAWVDQAAESA
jgi:hypothetical protein